MGVKTKKRRCYTYLTNFTAIILVMITFYAVAMLQNYKEKKENKGKNDAGWSPAVCDPYKNLGEEMAETWAWDSNKYYMSLKRDSEKEMYNEDEH